MIYNQDDEQSFLSDKKIKEVENVTENAPRRRGGAYAQEKKKEEVRQPKEEAQVSYYDEKESIGNKIVVFIAVVVIIVAVILLVIVFTKDSGKETNTGGSTTTTTTGTSTNIPSNANTNANTANTNNKENNSDSNSNNLNNTTTTNNYAVSSTNENYDAYPVKIESVVFKKAGNFYNNNDKIKGDKVYVEYKQISGLKDSQKQEKINEMLKDFSVKMYDKNYLSDKECLFVDITTKLSVNFNTLSYVVVKQGQDIDGKPLDEEIKSLNIRLDTLEEIKFEKLFVDNANIKNIYSNYVSGQVNTFYFDPENIYVYTKDLKEEKISMAKNYSNIAIYKRFGSPASLVSASPTSKKVFTTLNSTVSTETINRAFETGVHTKTN